MGFFNEMGKEGGGPAFGGKGFAHIELEIWQDIRYIQKANENTNLDDQTESMTSVGDFVTVQILLQFVGYIHNWRKCNENKDVSEDKDVLFSSSSSHSSG